MVSISDMLSSTELLHSINLEAVIQLKLNVYLITELIKHQSLLPTSGLPLSCKYRAPLIILSLQADRVREVNPHWDDEDIFQAARRRVIASLQSIIMYEYLPAFLGTDVAPYPGYSPDTHPGISHVFQSAAFRSVLGIVDRLALCSR